MLSIRREMTPDNMNGYDVQLGRLRFWNRVGIGAVISIMPATILAGVCTRGTVIAIALPSITSISLFVILAVSYVRIRLFRCPRCGDRFTVKRTFSTNTRGRVCVHCGLDAYAKS
jgi:hypothetical protein